jgi:hypothetical protein
LDRWRSVIERNSHSSIDQKGFESMASLKNLTATKNNNFPQVTETNVESGQIFHFQTGATFEIFHNGICFKPCQAGTAIIEIWGAGGSSAQMCCCGYGLPGNPGAYAKKTVILTCCGYICGQIGQSCGNSSALCFRGCSDPTGVVYYPQGTSAGQGCVCAQGGRGGLTYCSTGTNAYCCWASAGFYHTLGVNGDCGIICNKCCSGGWCAQAYGGDFNCPGGFSCVSYLGASGSSCPCATNFHLQSPHGYYAKCGVVVSHNGDDGNGFANWSGQGRGQYSQALAAASRWPQMGAYFATCWGFSGNCGCYENEGCQHLLPPGFPGTGPHPCPGVRDHAHRGGQGAIRIKWIAG